MALATNFKDDVLADSEQRRRYRIIENDDGTISLEDVTEYSQTGSKFGALEVNQERQAINDLDVNKINYTDIVNALTSTATNKPLSAAQGKSLSDRIGSLSSLTTSVKTSIVNAINSLMSGKVNFTDIVNNLTTTAANKALDARQGKALNDKITGLTGRITGGLHMDYFLINSGQGILYLRMQKTNWNKAYAFIFGCRNIEYVLSETIYAFYDPTDKQIKFFAEGPLKNNWTADQTSGGSNVQVNLPENSQGIVIWYGFQDVGTV